MIMDAMNWIFNKKKGDSTFYNILKALFLILTFLYGISIMFFNRPQYSKILVAIIIIYFVLTILLVISKKEIVISPAVFFIFGIIFFVFMSNMLAKTFSLESIIFCGLLLSSYLFVSFEKLNGFVSIIFLLCVGASIGCALICIHYLKVGSQFKMDHYFGNVDGVSGNASTFAALLLSITTISIKKRNAHILLICLCIVCSIPLVFISI